MSVVFVILGFVLICLVLVHLNLQQKKNQLHQFIKKSYKTLLIRHKRISKLINFLEETPEVQEIKILNEETMAKIEQGDFLPSQRVRAEILLEDKIKKLILNLESKNLSNDIKEAIESYKKTQKKIEKNKTTYNQMIAEFMEACNIKPASLYASFEKIDTDYPKILPANE